MWMDGATDWVLCAACAICGERSVECVVCAIYDEREGSTGSRRYTYSGAYQCMRVFLLNDYYILQRYTGAHAHTFAHTFHLPRKNIRNLPSRKKRRQPTESDALRHAGRESLTENTSCVESPPIPSHRRRSCMLFSTLSPSAFRVVLRPESSRPRGQSAGRPSRRHSRGLRAPPPRRRRRGVIRGRRR